MVHMRERIEVEYEDAANSIPYDSGEGGYQLATMDGYDILEEVGVLWLENESLCDDLAAGFMDVAWVHKQAYSLTEESVLRISWEEFANLVKHRVRYLQWGPDHQKDEEVIPPAAMLDELGNLLRRQELFTVLKAGTELVRVRVHGPDKKPTNTLSDFGPPPIEAARFANRMSPAGVSMLYAAFDEPTALAESHVRRDGQPAEASVAILRLSADLSVLDLTAIPDVPTIFDSDAANLDRPTIGFLHDFVRDLTKPVAKDGREHIEYVPSQVVTEYVRYRLPSHVGRSVHGVIYGSARMRNGIGCVLFYAHEDIIGTADRPIVQPPLELVTNRTRTIAVD